MNMKLYICRYKAEYAEDSAIILVAASSKEEAIGLLEVKEIFVHPIDVDMAELVYTCVKEPQIISIHKL